MSRNSARLLAIASVAAGLALVAGAQLGGPHAQTALPEPSTAPAPSGSTASPGALSFDEVPFFGEWASSPHADRAAESFTHWNGEGAIPANCARCHSTPGFIDYVGGDGTAAGLVDNAAPVGTVITCVACHNDKTLQLTSVTFPSGLTVRSLGADAICMTCHQGVESANGVTKAVAGLGDDDINPKQGFINVHYRAAGATLYGTMAQVAYQYPGKSYAARFEHQEPYARCTACHDLHTVEVKVNDCATCHKAATDKASLRLIRTDKVDYDGDGDVTEGVAQEIDGELARLLAAIEAYAKTISGKPIVYAADSYPYFFVDLNGNGAVDEDETKVPNKYNAWTPRLLKAAYNYQFVVKDPGAFAHNPVYTLQIVYDSLSDLGAKVPVDLSRPKRP
jgi:hypothetical protein